MPKVTNEIFMGGVWRVVGQVPEETCASLSSEHPIRGRQVYLYGWHKGKGPALWRSTLSVDVERDLPQQIDVLGFKKLVTLSHIPHIRIIYNPKYGPVRMRFTVA